MRYFLIYSMIFLSGCSAIQKSDSFTGRTNQYLSAKSIPPLRIPPDLSSDQFQNYYPLSDKNYSESVKNVSVVPPGLGSL